MSSLLPGEQIYTLYEVEEIDPAPIKIGEMGQKKPLGLGNTAEYMLMSSYMN